MIHKNYPIILIFCLLIFTFSCKDDEEIIEEPIDEIEKLVSNNEQKITIKSGLAGTVIFTTGLCGLDAGGSGGNCKSVPYAVEIHVYRNIASLDSIFGITREADSVNAEFLGIVKCDKDGFFQIQGEEGRYSLFFDLERPTIKSLYYQTTVFDDYPELPPGYDVEDSVNYQKIDLKF